MREVGPMTSVNDPSRRVRDRHDASPDHADCAEQFGIPARILFVETPNEEQTAGKKRLLDAGAFAGGDVSSTFPPPQLSAAYLGTGVVPGLAHGSSNNHQCRPAHAGSPQRVAQDHGVHSSGVSCTPTILPSLTL